MSNSHRIAVIIPVYNRAHLVLETLQSVDEQRRLPDEIVIVDDGSSDDSVAVIKNWKPRRAPAVKLIEQPNRGAATAMNVAIENASTDLIAPLDSDDVFLPDHLERLESAYKRFPDLAVAAGNSGRLDSLPYGRQVAFGEEVFEGMPYDEEPDGLRVIRGSAYKSLLIGAYLPTCSTLFSKQKAVEAGLYDPTLRTHYDQDFWLRMATVGRYAIFMDQLSLVRKHESNVTHRRNRSVYILCGLRVAEKMLGDAKRLGLTDDEIKATRARLVDQLRSAPHSASRYGIVSFARVCTALLKQGYVWPLIAPKAVARAILRPQGDPAKLYPGRAKPGVA